MRGHKHPPGWVGVILGSVVGIALVVLLNGLMPRVEAQNTWLTMQSAATTGNGTPIERFAADTFTICVEWAASTTAGVITIEEVYSSGSSITTWSPITTVTWAAADTAECVHLPPSAYGAIRARISTDVVGATVSVFGRGNR